MQAGGRLVAATLQAAVQLPPSLYPLVQLLDADGALLTNVGAPLVLLSPVRIRQHATSCHEPARSESLSVIQQEAGFRAAAFHYPNAYSHLALAGVLQKVNQSELALAHYDAVLALGPSSTEHMLVPALHNSGLLLGHQMNNKTAAAMRFERLVSLVPADSHHSHMAHNELALMQIERGEVAAARTRLRRVLAYDPSNRLAGQNMAYVLFNLAKEASAAGRHDEAHEAHVELKKVVHNIADRRGQGPAAQPPGGNCCGVPGRFADGCAPVFEASEYLPQLGYQQLCDRNNDFEDLSAEILQAQQQAPMTDGTCDTTGIVYYQVNSCAAANAS